MSHANFLLDSLTFFTLRSLLNCCTTPQSTIRSNNIPIHSLAYLLINYTHPGLYFFALIVTPKKRQYFTIFYIEASTSIRFHCINGARIPFFALIPIPHERNAIKHSKHSPNINKNEMNNPMIVLTRIPRLLLAILSKKCNVTFFYIYNSSLYLNECQTTAAAALSRRQQDS